MLRVKQVVATLIVDLHVRHLSGEHGARRLQQQSESGEVCVCVCVCARVCRGGWGVECFNHQNYWDARMHTHTHTHTHMDLSM